MLKISRSLAWLTATCVLLMFPFPAVAGDNTPEVFVQMGHSRSVDTMVFSKDGMYVVTGSDDKTVKLWDVASGSEVRTFSGHTNDISSVGVSDDRRYVFSGDSKGTVKIWDALTGKEIRSYKKHDTDVRFVRFYSENGRLVSADSNKLEVWDAFTGAHIAGIDSTVGYNFSPANNHVLSCKQYNWRADSTYAVHDIATLRQISTFEANFKDSPSTVAFSKDGTLGLILFADSFKDKYRIELWDMVAGRRIHALEKHSRIWGIALSPDGKYGVIAGDNPLLFDAHTGEDLKTYTDKTAKCALFSPDGRRILFSQFFWNVVALYDVSTGEPVQTLTGRGGVPVHSMDISADGTLALTAEDGGKLRVWDLQAGALARTMKGNSKQDVHNEVENVAISPNGKYGVSGGFGIVRLWQLATGRNLRTWDLYAIEGREPLKYLEETVVTSVTFSPDNRYIALIQGGYAIIIDVESSEFKVTFKGWVRACPISFSPDGKYFMLSKLGEGPSPPEAPGKAMVWDIENAREVNRFEGIGAGLFSPDSKHVLYGDEEGLTLREIHTGNKIKTFKAKAGIGFYGVGWWTQPLGPFTILKGRGPNVVLYESDSLWEKAVFKGHTGYLTAAKCAPDGQSVFSSNFDGTMRLWNANDGGEIARFITFPDGEWIIITPDGYYNSSVNGDKYLNVCVGNRVYSIDQYRSTFYKPRMIATVLGHDADGARALAANAPDIPAIQNIEPPFVVIKSPEADSKTDSTQAEIALYIEDRNQTIKDVKVFVNGRVESGKEKRGIKVSGTIPKGQHSLELKVPVHLDIGDNLIEVTAFNGFSEGRTSIRLYVSASSADKGLMLPNLWILAIGIDQYQDDALSSLSYAAADAQAIEAVFRSQKGRLFREVNSLVITDHGEIKPTHENIVDNLNYLSRAGHNDVAMLFIAGHGMNDDRGDFYFLPRDASIMDDGTIKRSRAISWRDIKALLDMPAKKLIFADTCHSEGVSGKKTRGVDNDRFVKELQEANAVIFTSSTGRELSQESDDWKHGAFTYALIEGVNGKADLIKDNKISMKELDAYVSETVPKITKGAQHPITHTPDGYVNFPVAIVK